MAGALRALATHAVRRQLGDAGRKPKRAKLSSAAFRVNLLRQGK